MSHSIYTNLGSNQDPDDWHSQKVDREREAAEYVDEILQRGTLIVPTPLPLAGSGVGNRHNLATQHTNL